MFYNRFMEICQEYGEKPTPVLKKLDISPGNLKRWESGASITAETLEKIANYFGVPVDYLKEQIWKSFVRLCNCFCRHKYGHYTVNFLCTKGIGGIFSYMEIL